MTTCQYCGEDFAKGGAYATHVRYCDERPDSGELPEDGEAESTPAGDALSPETHEDGSADGVVTETSDTSHQTQSTESEKESGAAPVGGEIRGRTDKDQSSKEPSHSPEYAAAGDQWSAKWLVAGVLILLVVVVWILLRSGEDE